MDIKFPPLVKGILKERINRFTARVEIEGQEALAHVPNSGRLKELLLPGTFIWLKKDETSGNRKTAYDLLLVEKEGKFISIDSRLPNDLVAVGLAKKKIRPLRDVTVIKREKAAGISRFDFYLEDSRSGIWLETKSVNLVENHVAKFPDAPTERGTRHLYELKELKSQGLRAVVLFLVLRDDAVCFSPHRECDPAFSRALEECIREGVEVYAFLCDVEKEGISIAQEIPVISR